MANSDKNILITPQTGQSANPTIKFTGGANNAANTVTLTVENDGSLNFSSSLGDLFNITNSFTGVLFSVNDANTVPIIEIEDTGTIYLNEIKGQTLIGTATHDGLSKLQVVGNTTLDGTLNTIGGKRIAPFKTSVTYNVTVADKTSAHPYFGQGSNLAYFIDGIESPHIILYPDIQYTFDQSDGSNSGHPLAFYLDAGKGTGYTVNYTYNGTEGQAGGAAVITITGNTPALLYYQCTQHGFMGYGASIYSRTLYGFDTDDLDEGSTNLYFTDARAQGAFSQGTGVTISSGTISIGQNVATNQTPQFAGLQTNGTITINNGASRRFVGPELHLTGDGDVITLNADAPGVAPTANVAIVVNRGSATDSYIGWDESNDKWVVHDGTSEKTILTSSSTTIDADTLDGQDGTYYLDYSNFSNTPSSILDFNITDGNAGQVLQTDGNGNFSFTTVTGGGGGGGSGFVAVNVYHYTSSGSSTFGTATNQWLYFQPFVNGSLVDDSNYAANSATGIVTITPAPTTGSEVTIWAYNTSVLDNVDLLSVANTGDLTVTGDISATNIDASGYINYGQAQQGTGTGSLNTTAGVNIFTFTSNNYRSAKLMIWITRNSDAKQQVTEALVLVNGSQPQITTYGTISTDTTPLAEYDAVYDAGTGTTNVQITCAVAQNHSYKYQYTLLES